MKSHRICFGVAIWLLFLFNWRPQFQEPRWIVVLLLFSPLVLMPFSAPLWGQRSGRQTGRAFEVPAACLLAVAFLLAPGWWAAFAALPWMMVRGLVAVDLSIAWLKKRPEGLGEICLGCACQFPAIGAAWLLADRAGWRPLGFDALVVLLTAAHFHHAGFTLPLVAGLLGRNRPGRLIRLSSLLILAGVPLVAVGITFTHLALWQAVEPLAALVLVSGALGVALSQMRAAMDPAYHKHIRAGLLLSGVSLFAAMLLAACYGLRSFWPGIALPMPSMWAVHGTLNAFGFGLLGLGSWRALLAGRAEN